MKKFLCGFLILISIHSWADDGKLQAIHFYLENDSRNIAGPGSDNAYSSGLKLSYIAAEDKVPLWAEQILKRSETLRNAIKDSQSNFDLSLGHQIYTPNDIKRKDLVTDDRPYAAWLYLGLSAHFQNPWQSHTLELDFGIIGPEAGGRPVQNGFHRMIGTYDAEGWSHQLATEPTIQLSYQQRLRFIEGKFDDQKYFDVVPFFGGGFGTVSVDGRVGGMVRLGNIRPDDLGPARPSITSGESFVNPITTSKGPTSIYIFAAGQGIAVARNVFLDGNTFRKSHHVKKYPFIVETEIGIVGHYRQWSGSWRFVTRSPEFEQKSVVNSFASVSLGYAYN